MRQIPAEMVEVSKTRFWAFVMGTRRNVHPSPTHPDFTIWKDQRTRERVGWESPGWKYPGQKRRYALARNVEKEPNR